jgi:hypothetical protein
VYAHPNVNDVCIMLGTHVFGGDGGIPCVALVILAGDERAPSRRRTVVRTGSETPAAFRQRVVDTVRELKAGRRYDHTVSIFHRTKNTRSAGEWLSSDARWNMRQINIHTAYHSRSSTRRVAALCKLYDGH